MKRRTHRRGNLGWVNKDRIDVGRGLNLTVKADQRGIIYVVLYEGLYCIYFRVAERQGACRSSLIP